MTAMVIQQFHQQSRMWHAAVDDVDAERWTRVPAEGVNPICFLATHLAGVRYYVAKYVELEVVNPLSEEVQMARSASAISRWPSSDELVQAWRPVDAALEARIGELDAAWLDASMETRIPWGVRTRRDMIAFFAHHEAYHLGQMGSLRSMLGLPALMMKLAGL